MSALQSAASKTPFGTGEDGDQTSLPPLSSAKIQIRCYAADLSSVFLRKNQIRS